jgi:hypothetical protein
MLGLVASNTPVGICHREAYVDRLRLHENLCICRKIFLLELIVPWFKLPSPKGP